MSMAIRRGWRPLTGRAPDQGLRLVDSQEMASHTATGVFAGPGEPSDCQLSLQGSKSSTWNATEPRNAPRARKNRFLRLRSIVSLHGCARHRERHDDYATNVDQMDSNDPAVK